MSAEGPIFIDQFGTTPTHLRPPSDPWWKAGPRGQMELWRAFWICFVFGHGIVIGFGLGLMVVAMVFGLAFDPATLGGGFVGLAGGAGVLGLVYFVFVAWSVVSVWRCAGNCVDKRRGLWARGVMVAYCALVLYPALSWLMEWS
jgi:hypothetical protein